MDNATFAKLCADLTAKFNSSSPNLTIADLKMLRLCHPSAIMKVTTEQSNKEEYMLYKKLVTAYAIILIVTAIIGVIGNFLVITAYIKQYHQLNPCRFLNLHLACCDFIFAFMRIFTAIPQFTGKMGEARWPFGLAFCKLSRACHELGGYIALGTILIIAIERYRGIIYPLRSIPNAKSRIKKALAVAWILGLGSSVPTALVYEIHPVKGHCSDNWPSDSRLQKTFSFYALMVFGLLPLVIIVFCYSRIIRVLTQPKERNAIYANLPAEEMNRRRKSEMCIIKMLLLVVIAFFICVLPGRITTLILTYIGNRLPLAKAFTYAYIGNIPYPFHVAVNPFIYSLKDRKFLLNAFRKEQDHAEQLTSKKTSAIAFSEVKLVSIVKNDD